MEQDRNLQGAGVGSGQADTTIDSPFLYPNSSNMVRLNFTQWLCSRERKYNQRDWVNTDIPQRYRRNGSLTSNLTKTTKYVPVTWQEDPPLPSQVFHHFLQLPITVRKRIWKHALPGPRISRLELSTCNRLRSFGDVGGGIHVGLSTSTDFADKGILATLRITCKESKKVVMDHYSPITIDEIEEGVEEGKSKKAIINIKTLTFDVSTNLHPFSDLIDYEHDTVELSSDQAMEFQAGHTFLDLTHVQKLALSTGWDAEFFRAIPRLCPQLKELTIILGASYDHERQGYHSSRLLLSMHQLRDIYLQDLDDYKLGEYAFDGIIPSKTQVNGWVEGSDRVQTYVQSEEFLGDSDLTFWENIFLKTAADAVLYTDKRPRRQRRYLLPLRSEDQYPGVVFYTPQPIPDSAEETHMIRISDLGCWAERSKDGTLVSHHSASENTLGEEQKEFGG